MIWDQNISNIYDNLYDVIFKKTEEYNINRNTQQPTMPKGMALL